MIPPILNNAGSYLKRLNDFLFLGHWFILDANTIYRRMIRINYLAAPMKIVTRFFLVIALQFLCLSLSKAQGNSLLWRVSGNGLHAPSYLYGTMHSKDSRVFHFPDSVMAAFDACEAFAMEVILNPEIQMQVMRSVMMDSTTILPNLLTPEQYDSADRFCWRNLGYSLSVFDHIKPVYTSVILAQASLRDTTVIAEHEFFLDEYFQHEADHQQKPVFGLETASEQMEVFDLIDYRQQAELMMQTVRTGENDTLNLEGMIRLYMSNDLNGMMKFENDFKLPDTLYNSLFTERNIKMAMRIDTLIRRRSVFIAVGAGHLGEGNGLVELLRNKGYTVLPVLPTYNNCLQDGWYRYHSPKKKFNADFPSIPSKEIKRTATTAAYIFHSTLSPPTIASFYVFVEEITGSVDADSQKKTADPRPTLKFLFGDSVDIKVSGDTHGQQDFEMNWTEGRRVTGTFYHPGERNYYVYCVYKKSTDRKKIKRFFDSFQILP
jgi:uncharacterized protein YbaP (TraB family)